MRRTHGLLAVAFVTGLLWSGNAVAQEKQGKEAAAAKPATAMCPVMGMEIDRKSYTMYRDKRVYFCCDDCKGKFAADPDKYADAVKEQWEALKPMAIQVTCPGTGKAINKEIFADTDHGPVYFCCKGCQGAWEKDSTKMQAKLKDCMTFQTTCPISGKEIDPSVSTEIDGRTVYACCGGCLGKLAENKETTFKNIDEQIKKNKLAWAKRHTAGAKGHDEHDGHGHDDDDDGG